MKVIKIILLTWLVFLCMPLFAQVPTVIPEQLGDTISKNNTFLVLDVTTGKPFIFRQHPDSPRKVLLIANGQLLPHTTYHTNQAPKIIAIDIDNNRYKFIAPTANGNVYNQPMGTVVSVILGPQHKLYLLSGQQGGLLEYDYVTEEFKLIEELFHVAGASSRVSPFTMYRGVDSCIYVSSYGSPGDTYLYKYNPLTGTRSFFDHMKVNSSNGYLYYISDDATHVYASCGQEPWNLYAISKDSPFVKTTIITNKPMIQFHYRGDGVYVQVVDEGYYKITPTSVTPVSQPFGTTLYYPRDTQRLVSDSLFVIQQSAYPKIKWDNFKHKLYFKTSATSSTQVLSISDLPNQAVYVEEVVNYKDSLVIGFGPPATVARYIDTIGNFKFLGGFSSASIYSTLNAQDSLFIGSYATGNIWKYDPLLAWTQDSINLDIITDTLSPNPKVIYHMNNVTLNNTLFKGTQVPTILLKTKSGYLVSAGEIKRDGEGIVIAAYKNGILQMKEGYYDYRWVNGCLSNKGTTVYLSSYSSNGLNEPSRIYEYDPSLNQFIDSFIPFNSTNPIKFIATEYNTLICFADNKLFEYDVNLRSVVWETTSNWLAMNISNLMYGPDGYIWFTLGSSDQSFFRLNPYTRRWKYMFNIPQRTGNICFINGDMYLGGEKKIRRIKNAVVPLPKNISYRERKLKLLNEAFE